MKTKIKTKEKKTPKKAPLKVKKVEELVEQLTVDLPTEETKVGIAKLTVTFGREDLDTMVEKLNEVIDKLND